MLAWGVVGISQFFRELVKRRMLVVLLLGFSSGLPIMILYSTLKLWFRREGIEISTIGYISWVTIPYSINFLWAPLLDRFVLSRLGRRRSWLFATQIGLATTLLFLGFLEPTLHLELIVGLGILLCLFSATQDIAVDAYRREILPDHEQGVGASIGVYGYRIAMWVANGFGIWIVDPETLGFTFGESLHLMAIFMLVGISTTLVLAREPESEKHPENLVDAVVNPFLEFFSRRGSLVILLFILLFKIGDAMAGSMLRPFYADVGFSNREIGEAASTVGSFSSLAGLFIGGTIIYRFGIHLSLWSFGILQAISTLTFAVLAFMPPSWWLLAGVVAFEDLSSGMGTAALVAFMATMSNRQFTATQYALFASLASFGRTFLAGFAGDIIQFFKTIDLGFLTVTWPNSLMAGYGLFFILCSVMAIPGLFFLHLMIKLKNKANESA